MHPLQYNMPCWNTEVPGLCVMVGEEVRIVFPLLLKNIQEKQQGINALNQCPFLLGGFELTTYHLATHHVETEIPQKVIRLGTFKSSFSPVVLRNSYSVLMSKGDRKTAELPFGERREMERQKAEKMCWYPTHLRAAPIRDPGVCSHTGEQPFPILTGRVWTSLCWPALRREGKHPMKVS